MAGCAGYPRLKDLCIWPVLKHSGIVVAFQHDISGLPHVVVGAFGDESSVGHYRKFVVRAELYENPILSVPSWLVSKAVTSKSPIR